MQEKRLVERGYAWLITGAGNGEDELRGETVFVEPSSRQGFSMRTYAQNFEERACVPSR